MTSPIRFAYREPSLLAYLPITLSMMPGEIVLTLYRE